VDYLCGVIVLDAHSVAPAGCADGIVCEPVWADDVCRTASFKVGHGGCIAEARVEVFVGRQNVFVPLNAAVEVVGKECKALLFTDIAGKNPLTISRAVERKVIPDHVWLNMVEDFNLFLEPELIRFVLAKLAVEFLETAVRLLWGPLVEAVGIKGRVR
jgi:hypothetical protein